MVAAAPRLAQRQIPVRVCDLKTRRPGLDPGPMTTAVGCDRGCRSSIRNTDIWGYGSRRGGRDDGEFVDANFQTTGPSLRANGSGERPPDDRLREAIQCSPSQKSGLLRRARNDGARVRVLAARHRPSFARNSRAFERTRAQGMPDARCTRSFACKKETTHAHLQGPPETNGIPCAMVLTAPPWSPWCTGLVSHHRLRELRPAS
jgi:hypothetical protein